MKSIEINGISKSFGKTKALSTVSLSVEEGELFGLIGPDGAGKSTLFNILVTLLNPDKGSAIIDNLDLLKDYKKIRKIIGYLPGQFSLYSNLTCYENLEFFATLYGESIEKNYELISPIWKHLEPFKDRRAANLSGGMKQKLSLCCALIHKPKILFLDEPTTGVDPVSRRELWDILKKLKDQNITVFVSTSYMDEATLCNRIALIQNGKILGSNTPQEIKNNFDGCIYAVQTNYIYQLLQYMRDYAVKDIYAAGQQVNIVLNNQTEVGQLDAFLDQSNIAIDKKQFIVPSIEDCFIQLLKDKNDTNGI